MNNPKYLAGGYHHITRDDRVILAGLLREGYSQAQVARAIGKDPSAISRELKRNGNRESYHATHAQVLARIRRKDSKEADRKIEHDSLLAKTIEAQLHPLVSPEVIAHDLPVSAETIYAWIYRSRPDLKAKLPQRGRKRRRYGSKREKKQGWTRNVRNIEERPSGANSRTRIGHFEGDTLRGVRGALLTHTDRKSRFEIVHKLANEGADGAYAAIVEDTYLKAAFSITYDRGSTFSLWKMIERDTNACVYFANAHHPWERGTNENSNQRLRRVFPKGTDFSMISETDIRAVVWIMNHTKRKCLNWRTPCKVFKKCCASN